MYGLNLPDQRPTTRDVSPVVAAEPAWVSLFSRPAFHALNPLAGGHLLSYEHRDQDRLVGRLGAVVADGVAESGRCAPFGGIDLARDHEPPDVLAALVREAVAHFRDAGASALRIRCKPDCWSPAEPTVRFALLNAGFRLVRAELNQHLDLTRWPDAEAYVDGLRSPARRALGHLRRDDLFAVGEPQDEAAWRAAWALLGANRAARGRRLALDADYVLRARDAFPEALRMLVLRHGDLPCAAALVYRVQPGRDVVVAWGDAGHALERSPMNLLAFHVVERALRSGVRLLDLGISSEHGPDGALHANGGLARFKRSIGAQESLRVTLEREL